MMARGARAAIALLGMALLTASPLRAQESTKRLSRWLAEQPARPDAYPLGLSWRVPSEEPSQLLLKHELLESLAVQPKLQRLQAWLRSLPVTGRVPVLSGDTRWLLTHPSRDPVLLGNHTVVLPVRPQTVTVVMEDGDLCAVHHSAGREAFAYVAACSPARARDVDWAWIAQPDGRVERYGVAPWNRETQDEPAPGAWIWAPARDLRVPEHLSDRLARFLATQGPAPDHGTALTVPASAQSWFSLRSRDAAVTRDDWGEVGLLQTPTARMQPASTLAVTLSHAWPYTRGNVFFQPFDWMEVGFRYTDIANQLFGPGGISTQTNKDKSVDAKLRVWRESRYVPQIALGFRDLAGTGLFSGEYVVGSKRYGPLDFSLGLGWGYVGGRGDVRNPLHIFGEKFETRPPPQGSQGGTPGFKSYFRGPAAFFGGVQYQTPWAPLTLKLEREGNDYQHEPNANNQPQRSAWNVGLSYRLGPNLDLTAGVERGNRLALGLSLHAKLDEAYTPKLNDPPRVPYTLRPRAARDWSVTSRDIAAQTGWHVSKIEQSSRDLRVTLLDADATYWGERVDRIAAVLNRDAPPEIDRFTLVERERGVDMAEHVIDRDAWAAEQTRPVPPHEKLATVIAQAPVPVPDTSTLYAQDRRRFEAKLGGEFIYTLGGPDAFILYQVAAAERLRFWIRDDTWIRSNLRLRLVDNYDRFRINAPSDLPRVRTFLREYLTTSRFTMPNLQMTHMGRLTDKQYYSVYAGYFEEMFGGIGGEWLYRPFASRSAIGVDANYVRQRDFEQDFGFRDYRVATGHATLYYDTGWNEVLATVSAGRYLAGDVGATLQLSRTFRNGVTVGAFATQTTARAKFGEGSFDKGIFLSIPFDAVLTRSTNAAAYVLWKPLTRDGGAKLARYDTLYTMTSVREERTLWYKPAAPAPDFSITSPTAAEPYLRTPTRASAAQWSADRRYQHELLQALYQQGFRDIAIDYDGAGRLTVRLANDAVRPPERAIGRATRTALRHAPLEAREIRIALHEGASPLAVYEFLDLMRLEQFFNGAVSAKDLTPTVAIYYADATRRPREPLAILNDLKTQEEPASLATVVKESAPAQAIERVAGDSVNAAKELPHSDWLRSSIAATSVVLLASTLDRRVFNAAEKHASSRGVKGLTSTGNAVPWLALGGAGLLALDGSDPVRQRTAFAGGEAGAAAFAAATGLKYVFGRSRPETGDGPRVFHPFKTDDAHNAFPSRHAAVAWAVATPFAAEYDTYWPYAAATVTTLGRAASREHWLSDSVGGSAIGYGLGRLFWRAARERHKDAPRFMLSTHGAALQWDLQ